MFCKTCGSILKPETTPYGRWMRCSNGHSQPEVQTTGEIHSIKNNRQGEKIKISDGKNHLAVHDQICKKCGYDKAELIEIAPFYSDEDAIVRWKCGQCGSIKQIEGKFT